MVNDKAAEHSKTIFDEECSHRTAASLSRPPDKGRQTQLFQSGEEDAASDDPTPSISQSKCQSSDWVVDLIDCLASCACQGRQAGLLLS